MEQTHLERENVLPNISDRLEEFMPRCGMSRSQFLNRNPNLISSQFDFIEELRIFDDRGNSVLANFVADSFSDLNRRQGLTKYPFSQFATFGRNDIALAADLPPQIRKVFPRLRVGTINSANLNVRGRWV